MGYARRLIAGNCLLQSGTVTISVRARFEGDSFPTPETAIRTSHLSLIGFCGAASQGETRLSTQNAAEFQRADWCAAFDDGHEHQKGTGIGIQGWPLTGAVRMALPPLGSDQ